MNWSVSRDPKRSPSGEISKFPTITHFPRAGNVLVVRFLAVTEEQPRAGKVPPVPRAEQAKAVPTDGCQDQESFTPARADQAAALTALCASGRSPAAPYLFRPWSQI